MYAFTCDLVGHIGIAPSEKYRKFFHVIIYLETVDFDIWKTNETCSNVNPFFNQVRYKNNWLFASSFVAGPAFRWSSGTIESESPLDVS